MPWLIFMTVLLLLGLMASCAIMPS